MLVEKDGSSLVAEQEMTRVAGAKKHTPCVACFNGGDSVGIVRGKGRHGRSVAEREDTWEWISDRTRLGVSTLPMRATKSFSLAKCSTREKGASRLPESGAEKWLAAEAKVYTSSLERHSGVKSASSWS